MVNHNGIKEQTGWKDRKVSIRGRLEGKDDEDIKNQIKSIVALGKKQKALSIISKETDTYGITKIAIEDDPQISLIEGFERSRDLSIEGTEDQETELHFDLTQKKREETKRITDPKKGKKEEIYVVKKGDSLSKIATEKYGKYQLWRRIYANNKDTIGSNPSLILTGQRLVIP